MTTRKRVAGVSLALILIGAALGGPVGGLTLLVGVVAFTPVAMDWSLLR